MSDRAPKMAAEQRMSLYCNPAGSARPRLNSRSATVTHTLTHQDGPTDSAAPSSVWLLTVQWGSDGEGGYGFTRRSIHATRDRAQAAADDLVTAITEAAPSELIVLRCEDEPGWLYTELDGGGYCPMAYSLEQMPVD